MVQSLDITFSKFGCSDITFSKFRHNLFYGIETQFFGHWDFFSKCFFTKSAPPIFLTIFDKMDEKSKSVPSQKAGAPIRFNFWVFFGCRRREYFDTFKSFCCFWDLDMAPTWAVPGLFLYTWHAPFRVSCPIGYIPLDAESTLSI